MFGRTTKTDHSKAGSDYRDAESVVCVRSALKSSEPSIRNPPTLNSRRVFFCPPRAAYGSRSYAASRARHFRRRSRGFPQSRRRHPWRNGHGGAAVHHAARQSSLVSHRMARRQRAIRREEISRSRLAPVGAASGRGRRHGRRGGRARPRAAGDVLRPRFEGRGRHRDANSPRRGTSSSPTRATTGWSSSCRCWFRK